MDILSRINWGLIDFDEIKKLPLSKADGKDETSAIGLSLYEKDVIEKRESQIQKASVKLDLVYVTRQLLDIVPNPWIAYQISEEVFSSLSCIVTVPRGNEDWSFQPLKSEIHLCFQCFTALKTSETH